MHSFVERPRRAPIALAVVVLRFFALASAHAQDATDASVPSVPPSAQAPAAPPPPPIVPPPAAPPPTAPPSNVGETPPQAPPSAPVNEENARKNEPLITGTSELYQSLHEKLDLLPVELTAFGDFRYRSSTDSADDFEVGSVELDVVLDISEHVKVSTAFAYDPEADVVRIAAFTVDGNLVGDGPRHHIRSSVIETSGVLFGKFDVPFGIAYLEYPSIENRLVRVPGVVSAVHGLWNDMGVQAYMIASKFNLIAFWLNGVVFPQANPELSYHPKQALGGRVGLRPWEWIELGSSGAWTITDTGRQDVYGADLRLKFPAFELKNEYLARRDPGNTTLQHGFYTQALGRWGPAFVLGRYESLLEGSGTTERTLGVGLGVEVIARAEVRVVHFTELDGQPRSLFVQFAGGSVWQPTGLRR